MTLLYTPELLIAFFVGCGLIVGSFLNVVIHRLPLMVMYDGEGPEPNLALPASHCPSCLNPLRWYHNIPLLSYIYLRGKCGWCGVKISWRYPLVEMLTAVVWITCLCIFGDLDNAHSAPLKALFWSLYASIFIAMVFIDFETMLLPDSLTLSAVWLSVLAALWGFSEVSTETAVYGAVIGYLFMRLFIFAGDKALGRQSMGMGDAKLVAAIGALVGASALPAVLIVASGSGIILFLLAKTRSKLQEGYLPFGPSLVIGGLAHVVGLTNYLHLV